MFQGQNFINVISREAIEEVNVSKGVISAEVGRTFSGNVNVITKSGTNNLHGSAFHNWQNDILNARYALLSPAANKPPIRFHQFGGSVGGPIVRDRLFYFFSYEGYRQSNFAVITSDVPTPEFRAQAIGAVPAYERGFQEFPNPTEPYSPGAAIGLWRGAAFDQAHDDHFVGRVDYQLRDADRLSLRYTHGRPYRIVPSALITNQREYSYETDSGNVTWSHATASWTSETRFGVNYNSTQRLDQAYRSGVPGFEIQGSFGIGAELQQLTGSTYSFEEIVAANMGRHTLKFGGLVHRASPGRFDEEVPQFRYRNPEAMLANIPNRVRFTFGVPNYRGQTWNYAGFIQDDFKIKPNLTLNLGLRYEYYSVFYDPEERVVNPGTVANLFADPIVLRDPKEIYNPDRNNFLPRVGLVWSPDQKTVLRGGAGISVGPQNLRHFYTMVRYSPKIGFRFTFTGAELESLGFKYPATNEEGRALVEAGAFLQSYQVFDENNPNPESYHWTFDIQRQVSPTTVVRAGYVGTRGLRLTLSHDVNRPDRVTGITPVPRLLQSLYRDASDNTTYHGLELSLNQRFARDVTFNAHYTWSKTMAVAGGDHWGANDLAVQDESNFAANWGPIPSDRTHRFNLDVIYEAPFARWTGASGPMEQVLGGWQFSGIFRASSGNALTVGQSSNYDASRPDYGGGDPYLHSGNRFEYLNPAAFSEIPEGDGGAPLRPGNVGKGSLRGPGAWDVDFAIAKGFSFKESYRLQFRAEMFNAFNHVNLLDPVTDITNGNFGRITRVGPARTMQLSGRFTF
jgi:outer membrane receptor protein involved in Fe transport